MVGRVPGDDQLPRVGDAVTRAQCQAPIKSQLIRSVGLGGSPQARVDKSHSGH